MINIKGPIGFMSEVVYNILIKLKVCSKTTYQYDVAAPTNITIRFLEALERDLWRINLKF